MSSNDKKSQKKERLKADTPMEKAEGSEHLKKNENLEQIWRFRLDRFHCKKYSAETITNSLPDTNLIIIISVQ